MEPAPTRARRRPLPDQVYWALVFAAVVVAGIVLWAGVSRTDTEAGEDPRLSGPTSPVEHLYPGRGDEVVRQYEVGIDLARGYEAVLLVNGTAIPTEELRLVPEQNIVRFKPAEGKVIEELQAGQNCVTAIAWRSTDGRGVDDQPISWCFEAT